LGRAKAKVIQTDPKRVVLTTKQKLKLDKDQLNQLDVEIETIESVQMYVSLTQANFQHLPMMSPEEKKLTLETMYV